MIRWSYVLPRLVVLVAAVLAIGLGLDPLLRWSLVSLGQQITSAKVEIGSLASSLGQSEICLRDVQVADPDEPMKNLVEAKEVRLALETGPLMRRKFIVREGRVSGLRLGTDRQTSGALERSPRRGGPRGDKSEKPFGSGLGQLAETWLDALAGRLEEQLAREVEQLESVRLTRDLVDRWPREFERLQRRANALKGRAEDLGSAFRGGVQGLLRNPDTVGRALGEMESIHAEAADFRAELDRLGRQALHDKDAIHEARRRDVESIRQRLRVADLQGENLSEYLLGPDLAEKVGAVADGVRWARRHWPQKPDDASPTRARGLDVPFAGPKPTPSFLIRQVAIDGEGQLHGNPFRFSGTAEGVTSDPVLYGRPAVLRLDVQGKAAMAIEAVVDHTGKTPCHHVTIECSDLPQPRRVLGRADRLAVAVSPGSTRLSLVLHLEGDGLEGRLTLRQEPVELAPAVASRFGGPRLAAELEEALKRIRAIEVTAELSGTLDEPECRLRSTLGPQLAEAMNWLIQRELEARREEAVGFLQGQIEGHLAQFDQLVRARQEALLAQLDLSSDQLRELRQLLGDRPGGVERLLGRPLRLEMPRRF